MVSHKGGALPVAIAAGGGLLNKPKIPSAPEHPSLSSDIRPANFFVFRTPLLPWNSFKSWTADLQASAADQEDLETALTRDKDLLRTRLRAWMVRPDLREALFLASPDLYNALSHWVDNPQGDKGLRVERGLVRYYSRMCGRSTPFGLFAGCSLGRIGGQTVLKTDGIKTYVRHTRLDMDYLCSLAEDLANDPGIQAGLKFRPNSSLYRAGGRLRYAEARIQNKARSYNLVAVEETAYLLDTLQRARGGAKLGDLATALLTDDISREEADSYLQALVESQILVPELTPAVTGAEPIHTLLHQLADLPKGHMAAEVLQETKAALDKIDTHPLGVSSDRYLSIANRLESLPTKVELNRLFQTDMMKPAPEAELGPNPIQEILKGVELLHHLNATSQPDSFAPFIQAFRERYGHREVPLMEVLDKESGIPLDGDQTLASEATPLLDGLAFPSQEGDEPIPWSARDYFLLKKLVELGRKGERILNLTAKDLAPFLPRNPPPMPDSFSVMATLAAASPEALENGQFKACLLGASGPSGANYLGRFCHADGQLAQAIQAYLKEEEALHPEAIFAEIVHLPEGRIGNVLLRPLLRGYEIPYLGRSGADEAHQIPITDLYLSVHGSRIVLRSQHLDREIFPRLSTAHNYSQRSLGLYRFLCMLQHQGRSIAGAGRWSWGGLAPLPFLPRVEFGQLVLSKARWRVTREEVSSIGLAKGADRWRSLQAWGEERELPRLLLFVDGDNKLPVDFHNILSVETFLDLVKNLDAFTLEEFYPDPEELCAEGPEGPFIHELIVPFTRVRIPEDPGPVPPKPHALRRSFAPGSEWLFAKLYTGNAGVDQILRNEIHTLLREVLASGAVDAWFFIRYGDPDWHLRLRLHGDPRRLREEVWPRLGALLEPAIEEGRIHKLVLDTYDREFGRYGEGEAMELSERLFQIDSEAVVGILRAYPGDAAIGARWRLCLVGLDLILDDLGFEPLAKFQLMSRIRASFFHEFHGDASFEHRLAARFRRERKTLEALLHSPASQSGPLAKGLAILKMRSEKLNPITARLQKLASEDRLGTSLEKLAESYLHMHANRLLRSAQRAQELVLYDFLMRSYDSQLARRRRSPGTES